MYNIYILLISSLEFFCFWLIFRLLCCCGRRLLAFPKGNGGVTSLSLYLDVAGSASLPYGWRRRAELCLSVVNQVSEELTEIKGDCFYRSCPQTILKTDSMIYIPKINHLDSNNVIETEFELGWFRFGFIVCSPI